MGLDLADWDAVIMIGYYHDGIGMINAVRA
jgi:hypothetical protein